MHYAGYVNVKHKLTQYMPVNVVYNYRLATRNLYILP